MVVGGSVEAFVKTYHPISRVRSHDFKSHQCLVYSLHLWGNPYNIYSIIMVSGDSISNGKLILNGFIIGLVTVGFYLAIVKGIIVPGFPYRPEAKGEDIQSF